MRLPPIPRRRPPRPPPYGAFAHRPLLGATGPSWAPENLPGCPRPRRRRLDRRVVTRQGQSMIWRKRYHDSPNLLWSESSRRDRCREPLGAAGTTLAEWGPRDAFILSISSSVSSGRDTARSRAVALGRTLLLAATEARAPARAWGWLLRPVIFMLDQARMVLTPVLGKKVARRPRRMSGPT